MIVLLRLQRSLLFRQIAGCVGEGPLCRRGPTALVYFNTGRTISRALGAHVVTLYAPLCICQECLTSKHVCVLPKDGALMVEDELMAFMRNPVNPRR